MGAIAPVLATVVGSVIGGMFQNKQQSQANALQNKALTQQYEYQNKQLEMQNETLALQQQQAADEQARAQQLIDSRIATDKERQRRNEDAYLTQTGEQAGQDVTLAKRVLLGVGSGQ